MAIPEHITNRFYSGKCDEKIKFCINDAVDIISGKYSGKSGAVISIIAIEPEVMFIVEIGDGSGDVNVLQSKMQKI